MHLVSLWLKSVNSHSSSAWPGFQSSMSQYPQSSSHSKLTYSRPVCAGSCARHGTGVTRGAGTARTGSQKDWKAGNKDPGPHATSEHKGTGWTGTRPSFLYTACPIYPGAISSLGPSSFSRPWHSLPLPPWPPFCLVKEQLWPDVESLHMLFLLPRICFPA